MGDTANGRSARTRWAMRAPFLVGGAVAMMLTLTDPVTAASPAVEGRSAITSQASGCNHDACLNVQTVGVGVSVWGEYAAGPNDPDSIYGHFHYWGPHYDRNSPDHRIQAWANDPYEYWFNSHGVHCMELWERLSNGTYRSRGLPCVSG